MNITNLNDHWISFVLSKLCADKNRVAIWGAGGMGRGWVEEFHKRKLGGHIDCFIDSDPHKHNTQFLGIPVKSIDDLMDHKPEYVIVSSYYESEIKQELDKRSYPNHRIVLSSEFHAHPRKTDQSFLWDTSSAWKSNPDPMGMVENYIRFLNNLIHTREKLDNYPVMLHIEPSRSCHLQCPMCKHLGRKDTTTQMPVHRFKALIDTFGPYLFYLHLYRKGESFIHKRFIEMLEYARQNTSALIYLSSNFSFRFTDEELKKMVRSSDYLGVCLDGTSEQTYNIYRIGGDFNLVRDNLKRIAHIRNEEGANCNIVWRFIVFRHNEHDIDEARKMAEDMGVRIDFVQPFVPDDSWLPENKSYWRPIYRDPGEYSNQPRTWATPCTWLYGSTGIGSGGEIYPCCEFDSLWDDFGTLETQEGWETMNDANHVAARSHDPGIHHPCQTCPSSIRRTSEGFNLHLRNIQVFIARNPFLVEKTDVQGVDLENLKKQHPLLVSNAFQQIVDSINNSY